MRKEQAAGWRKMCSEESIACIPPYEYTQEVK
jgi:hypothetical protein